MSSSTVLLITDNPLFMEVIAGSLTGREDLRLRQVQPAEASSLIAALRPCVLLVDDHLPPAVLEQVLQHVRCLKRARVLLLSTEKNDFVTLDSRHMQIHGTADLVQAVLEGERMNTAEVYPNGFAQQGEAAQARAGMYGFLAAFCNQRPDEGLVRRLRAIDVKALMAPEGDDPIRDGLECMSRYLDQTRSQDEATVAQDLAVDWTRLFRGVKQGYGPPPPYEAVHTGEDEIRMLKGLVSTYEQNGAYVHQEVKQRPDYIGVELDFMRYLAEREAQAWHQGQEAQALQAQATAEAFLVQHIANWLPKYCALAKEHAQTAFYQGVISVLRGSSAAVLTAEGA